MSSPFINLALAMPEGLDDAASALFVLGKDTLEEPALITRHLNDDAVRATRRGKVAAVVTAVTASNSPSALAAHQGDSRVLVQRALASNEYTPEPTLLWLLRGALRRADRSVLEGIVHRLPLEVAHKTLEESADARATIQVGKIAARVVREEEWHIPFARLPISQLIGALIAESIKAGKPFEHFLEHTSRPERELAQAVAHLGEAHPKLAPAILKAGVAAVVSATPTSRIRIGGPVWDVFFEEMEKSGNSRYVDRMLLTFTPEPECIERYRQALFASNERYHLLEPTLDLMKVSSTDELHTLLEFAAPRISEYQMHRVFSALPKDALQQTRDVVIANMTAHVLFKYLTQVGLLGESDAPALADHIQAGQLITRLWDAQVQRLPWYESLLAAFGSALLGLVATHRDAARYVATVLAERLTDNTQGVVLAAKLINDGFNGSLEELIETVKTIHPNPHREVAAEAGIEELHREQLMLF
jgi:hypothetical protein